MDLVCGLPRTTAGHDTIWVVVDRLTKSAHFIPIRLTYPIDKLSDLYIREVVRLHGVPLSIVTDRDPKFTSGFWKSLQKSLGSQLRLSTAYHPQTVGQSEQLIQILEDMFRACVLDFDGSWGKYLHLVEFSYNNSFQTSIGMSPYEALYGRPCRSPICWTTSGLPFILGPPRFVQDASEQIAIIRERIKAAQQRQKHWAYKRRKDLHFEVGDHVFLKVASRRGLRKSNKLGKLNPRLVKHTSVKHTHTAFSSCLPIDYTRYVGPFQITRKIGEVAYELNLPLQFAEVHNV